MPLHAGPVEVLIVATVKGEQPLVGFNANTLDGGLITQICLTLVLVAHSL